MTKRVRELNLASQRGVWQRGYYEHIIRNGEKMDKMRRYIEENPARWAEDPENPLR